MVKQKQITLDFFLKRKRGESSESNVNESPLDNQHTSPDESNPTVLTSNETVYPPDSSLGIQNTITVENIIEDLERDPGKRKQIWEYPVGLRDDVRRAYIMYGPFQPKLKDFPKSGSTNHPRRFQSSWYALFPSWLEYSPTKDAAFCLPCFLFNKEDNNLPMFRAFTVDGFRNWKKVREGIHCAFITHIGRGPNTTHKRAEDAFNDLLNQKQHIPQVFDRQTTQQIKENRLRLKVSVDSVLYLAYQGCALRGNDEGINSLNRGNFVELVKVIASYNPEVASVVLENAPKNASYISPKIQKEILQVLGEKVKRAIRDEIGDSKFCLLVDEAGDKSNQEQMAIVLRYVDNQGLIREIFFSIVHVSDISAETLKNAIYSVFSRYAFDVQNIRGQGYDGASNMRGEWKGLQALINKDCRFAYYVHCFAHRLQLALVAASREVIVVHSFFLNLTTIVNVVLASHKRTDELKAAYADEIAYLVDHDELNTGTGLNQIGTLQRAGDTRWGSHLRSIASLMKMFSPTCIVLQKVIDEGRTWSQRGDAQNAYDILASFDFVMVMHIMSETMKITDILSQAMQCKSQDILNALHLVANTKVLLQTLRDDGWNPLFNKVKLFCEYRNIVMPNFSSVHIERGGRARHQQDQFTIQDHYRINIFNATIDYQMQELNNRFNSDNTELLSLMCALDPRDNCKSFNLEDICKLVDKFYPEDFTEVEKEVLRVQLIHYELDISRLPDIKNLSTISQLCKWFVDTRKLDIYPLIYRVIKLVLTLPVSTATTERAFSAMNILKTRLRNKMGDEFLENCMLIFIEREIARQFDSDSIIDGFRDLSDRRSLF